MVQPVEEKLVGRTLEDRLAHKFDDLQIAREDHQTALFDEIARSIEVLFKGVPEAHKELMKEKSELDKDLQEELYAIEEEAKIAKDEIHRQSIYNSRGFKAMWDYREVYEEIIIEVMQKYQLIPMRKPIKSHLETPRYMDKTQMMGETTKVAPLPGFAPPAQNVPVPPPPVVEQDKPRLSFMKKRGENQPKDFKL